MKIVKGASGFGDSIYVRVIVEWLIINRPDEYAVATRYPDVFNDLNVKIIGYNDVKDRIDYDCRYLYAKSNPATTQWDDMLKRANLPYFPFTSGLKYFRTDLREINTLVIPPYSPMNGAKGSEPMKPSTNDFFNLIKPYENITFLTKKQAFLELVNMFNSSKLIISQTGWAVALAEMLDKPILNIFTRRALEGAYKFIATITPKKIHTKQTSICRILP